MNTLTVAHGAAGTGVSVTASSVTASTTQQFNSVFDVPIVTAISKDSAGHVTNVTLGTYRFKDTHQTINDFTVGVGSSTTSSATSEIVSAFPPFLTQSSSLIYLSL